MKPNNFTILSGLNNQNLTGTVIDVQQMVSGSFMPLCTDLLAAGTVKLQFCNDPISLTAAYTTTNWKDIPTSGIQVGSSTISSGVGAGLFIPYMAYRWLRAIYTSTGTGTQTIAPIADTGVKQVQTATTVADAGAFEVSTNTAVADTAGSLNSTYFTFSAKNIGGATSTNYYTWYSNGTGVDPAIPAATGIPVVYANDDTDSTIAGLTRTAITAGAGSKITVTGATNQFILTGKFMGNATSIADGAAPTGFTFTSVNGVASNLLNSYFLLSSVNLITKAQKNFYMWFNVNSEGTDPAVASKTAIPIAIAAGSTANATATAMRTALNALTNDFVATGANAAVISTNVAFGLVTSFANGTPTTGFTFSALTSGVTSNLVNKYFYLQDEASANLYYVWMNPDSIGTDPGPISGRTAVPIVYSSGASAGTIGAALATAIAALNSTNSFTATGTTTVTVTNKTAGPFVPITDTGATGFTFAVTAGGSGTITVNMFAHGY